MRYIFITALISLAMTEQIAEQTVANPEQAEPRPTYGINTKLYEKLDQIDLLLSAREPAHNTGLANLDASLEYQTLEHQALEQSQNLLAQCTHCNPYELATLHRYVAWLAFETGDNNQSLEHFEHIVALSPEIPINFELAALLALSKIYYQEEQFDTAWEKISAWKMLASDVPADIYELAARIQYFRGNKHAALSNMQTAISLVETEGKIAAKAWYLFARSLHYEKEDFSACLALQRKLVMHYSSDAHWRDLAIFYGLSGDSENQLAAYDTAWMLDGLEKEADILNFSWLLQNAGYPYKAADILEQAMRDARMAQSSKSLELTARAWYLAEEHGRAIASLEKATTLGAHGNLLVFLSELYMEADLYEHALEHLNQALKLGELKHPGRAHLSKGIALLELTRFSEAREAFEKAGQVKNSRETAERWLAHLTHEEHRHRQLQLSRL